MHAYDMIGLSAIFRLSVTYSNNVRSEGYRSLMQYTIRIVSTLGYTQCVKVFFRGCHLFVNGQEELP